MLWHGGDVDRRSGRTMDRKARWRGKCSGERCRRGDIVERSRGAVARWGFLERLGASR
jgi:hypothetical protein